MSFTSWPKQLWDIKTRYLRYIHRYRFTFQLLNSSILKSTVKISFLYEYSIQDQPIDYNVEKADDQNSDEDIYNFLDDYYTEVDADEVKENSEIQSNDYRE